MYLLSNFLNGLFFVLFLTTYMVIITVNPIHSVLYLIMIYFLLAILLFILGIEFIAILLIIIYVGAIAVLFLFVVMLLNIRTLELNQNSLRSSWWVGLILMSVAIILVSAAILYNFDVRYFTYTYLDVFDWSVFLDEPTNIELFGQLIYTNFADMLLLSAIVLLLAMIGPIYLCLRKVHHLSSWIWFSRKQNLSRQGLASSYLD